MARIKGWTKLRSTFSDAYYESVRGRELYVLDEQSLGHPHHGLWYVAVSRTPKKWFKTKKQALKYAKDFMRRYPNG